VYNDKRANPDGKVMPDVWIDIPRLCGTHKERIPGFPTQLPEALVKRILLPVAEPGKLGIDPHCDSGTIPKVMKDTGMVEWGIDCSAQCVSATRRRTSTW